MNDPIEVAYLAGFFDGEGCIGCYKPRYAPFLQVACTDREPLERFHAMFGGAFRRTTRNTVTGRIVWKWHLASPRSLSALVVLMPYLTVKRDQARVALQFKHRALKDHPGGRWHMAPGEWDDRVRIGDELRALKRIGMNADASESNESTEKVS